MSDNDYMVTQKEAADFLNVSTKSISRYRKRGLPYKLILNPLTGKQEVRFRYADLEKWDEGRQLLATYARDGEERTAGDGRTVPAGGRQAPLGPHDGFLNELLLAYKEQIELLRDQLEDMREQLARRDRQIDDLMRLMVGLQLEYKPMPAATVAQPPAPMPDQQAKASFPEDDSFELFEAMQVPQTALSMEIPVSLTPPAEPVSAPPPEPDKEKKVFSREQLSASIQRLRSKGKSYEEIARGLNQINVATISGSPEWTILEVQTLLPALVSGSLRSFLEEHNR